MRNRSGNLYTSVFGLIINVFEGVIHSTRLNGINT
jgi:hypothetical protein